MQMNSTPDPVRLARYTGWALMTTIVIGIASSVFIAKGIDINLSADIEGTARNMLDAETRVRGKAYIGVLTFVLNVFISLGWFLLLDKHGRLIAAWSALIGVTASLMILLGAVFNMNVAVFASNEAYNSLTNEAQLLMLAGVQVTSDYTSFHLGLVMASLANAGFFYVFLTSRLIPRIIAGWGLFASLLVVFMVVARDFIPALANNTLTMVFILANLIALVSTGFYLSIKGVRRQS